VPFTWTSNTVLAYLLVLKKTKNVPNNNCNSRCALTLSYFTEMRCTCKDVLVKLHFLAVCATHCCYLISISAESCHDDIINSQQRREIRTETGQATDRGRLPSVSSNMYVNNWTERSKYYWIGCLYRRVITSVISLVKDIILVAAYPVIPGNLERRQSFTTRDFTSFEWSWLGLV